MPWIFVVTLGVVGAAVVASYALQNRAGDEAPGLTSEFAAVMVFLLGGMVMVGDRPLAVALAVVTSALLAYKQPLHGLVGRIDRDDVFAGIKLLIASFIVLPLLPDRPIDPWQAINPYTVVAPGHPDFGLVAGGLRRHAMAGPGARHCRHRHRAAGWFPPPLPR